MTKRRLKQFGDKIELNPFMRLMCAVVGQPSGVIAGVFVPIALWTILAFAKDWREAYAFSTAYFLHLFIVQRASLRWEAIVQKALLAELGSGPSALPPAVEPPAPAANQSKEDEDVESDQEGR
jgi:hypothetical protein